jgi:hypothetical protein
MKYNRDIGIVSRRTEMYACGLIASAVIVAVACAFYKNVKESFQGNSNQGNQRKGKLMFNGSYPSAPVVCLAGNKHVPCTAFSSG